MITFKLEKDTKGYHTWSPELPGCHTFGATRAEALNHLKDAVRLYMDDSVQSQFADVISAVTRPKFTC